MDSWRRSPLVFWIFSIPPSVWLIAFFLAPLALVWVISFGEKRGIVDIDRAARIFLNEMRAGMLGPITLETPDMIERERAEVAVAQAEKAARKLTHKAERRARFKAQQNTRRGN